MVEGAGVEMCVVGEQVKVMIGEGSVVEDVQGSGETVVEGGAVEASMVKGEVGDGAAVGSMGEKGGGDEEKDGHEGEGEALEAVEVGWATHVVVRVEGFVEVGVRGGGRRGGIGIVGGDRIVESAYAPVGVATVVVVVSVPPDALTASGARFLATEGARRSGKRKGMDHGAGGRWLPTRAITGVAGGAHGARGLARKEAMSPHVL